MYQFNHKGTFLRENSKSEDESLEIIQNALERFKKMKNVNKLKQHRG